MGHPGQVAAITGEAEIMVIAFPDRSAVAKIEPCPFNRFNRSQWQAIRSTGQIVIGIDAEEMLTIM